MPMPRNGSRLIKQLLLVLIGCGVIYYYTAPRGDNVSEPDHHRPSSQRSPTEEPRFSKAPENPPSGAKPDINRTPETAAPPRVEFKLDDITDVPDLNLFLPKEFAHVQGIRNKNNRDALLAKCHLPIYDPFAGDINSTYEYIDPTKGCDKNYVPATILEGGFVKVAPTWKSRQPKCEAR
ncbi:unnamed protein product, partial [Mesorhabditis spiculigera]